MLIQDHRQLDLELESLTSSTAWLCGVLDLHRRR
jgi:hypothetical protein